jgi:hypothetical protein
MRSAIDPSTGDLLVGGERVFPIGLSDPPPLGTTAPDSGLPAWSEIAKAGVRFVRNYTVWRAVGVDEQLLAVGRELDAAVTHGLQLWLALAGLDTDLTQQPLLDRVVDSFKSHPGLGVWKGVDEPAHGHVPVAGCVEFYEYLRKLDPDHPLVIIEAPRGPGPTPGSPSKPLTAAAVRPYAGACDVHGVDIYPVSVPPGAHAGRAPVNTDISVVGDMTEIIVQATRTKAIWTTLQIAWSGVFPPHPVVFPTLQQARFMAYDAVIAGARGLFFFGGQFQQVMSEADRKRGWNWTYWKNVQRPLLVELCDPAHTAALLAPVADVTITANANDIALSARKSNGFLYLIVVRKSPSLSGKVRFSGLPAGVTEGVVLAHPGGNPERHVTVAGGAFTDSSPYAPHNARVYRFPLAT